MTGALGLGEVMEPGTSCRIGEWYRIPVTGALELGQTGTRDKL